MPPSIKATGAITTEEILSHIPQLANTFNTAASLAHRDQYRRRAAFDPL